MLVQPFRQMLLPRPPAVHPRPHRRRIPPKSRPGRRIPARLSRSVSFSISVLRIAPPYRPAVLPERAAPAPSVPPARAAVPTPSAQQTTKPATEPADTASPQTPGRTQSRVRASHCPAPCSEFPWSLPYFPNGRTASYAANPLGLALLFSLIAFAHHFPSCSQLQAPSYRLQAAPRPTVIARILLIHRVQLLEHLRILIQRLQILDHRRSRVCTGAGFENPPNPAYVPPPTATISASAAAASGRRFT